MHESYIDFLASHSIKYIYSGQNDVTNTAECDIEESKTCDPIDLQTTLSWIDDQLNIHKYFGFQPNLTTEHIDLRTSTT